MSKPVNTKIVAIILALLHGGIVIYLGLPQEVQAISSPSNEFVEVPQTKRLEFHKAYKRTGKTIPGKILTYVNRNGYRVFRGYSPGRNSLERLLSRIPQRYAIYRGKLKRYNYRNLATSLLSEKSLKSVFPKKSNIKEYHVIRQKTIEKQKQILRKEEMINFKSRFNQVRKYSEMQSVINAKVRRKKIQNERKKQRPRAFRLRHGYPKSRIRAKKSDFITKLRFRGKSVPVIFLTN